MYHDDPALSDGADHVVASTALMGDIVRLPSGEMDLELSLVASTPIERVDIFNGLDLVETITPFERSDLGSRIRILREGAAYRGRFREVIWDGRAEFIGNGITEIVPVNFLNPEKTLERTGNIAEWRSTTTGNSSGFDVMSSDRESGKIRFETPLVSFDQSIAGIGGEDIAYDVPGEMPRFVKMFRLPNDNPHKSFRFSRRIPLRPAGDNPVYIRLTQEDGARAWTSPIYVFRE